LAYDWILGIGLLVGLSIIFAFIVESEFQIAFIGFLFLFSGFLVYAGLIPDYVLIIVLMFLVMFVYFRVKNRGG